MGYIYQSSNYRIKPTTVYIKVFCQTLHNDSVQNYRWVGLFKGNLTSQTLFPYCALNTGRLKNLQLLPRIQVLNVKNLKLALWSTRCKGCCGLQAHLTDMCLHLWFQALYPASLGRSALIYIELHLLQCKPVSSSAVRTWRGFRLYTGPKLAW